MLLPDFVPNDIIILPGINIIIRHLRAQDNDNKIDISQFLRKIALTTVINLWNFFYERRNLSHFFMADEETLKPEFGLILC